MKKINFWLIACLFAGAILTTGCDKSNDSPEPTPPTPYNNGTISDGNAVAPADMKMSALSGFVYDSYGNPLQNVQVTSGTEALLTGSDGGFVLDKVNTVDGRSIVKFSCSGYFDVVRSMPNVDSDVWEVVMSSTYSYSNEKVASSGRYSYQDISVQTDQGMTVDLQANGFKFADSGEPLTSYDYVTAQILYLSPDDNDFATMMPGGDLAAVDADKDQVQLVSYGMVCVNISSNGRKVQLADGKPATVTFPVPDKFKDSEIPAEIPLWSFDEEKGLWVYEGVATYDNEKNVYVGTVTHFSWVNLDYPEKRATLKVNLKDEAGNVIPNQAVDIDGQRAYFTDVNGVVECYVPINTDFYVTVRSRDYSNYSPEVKVPVEKLTQAGSTRIVNIVLPTMVHISGKVVNSGKGNNLSSLWIEYVSDNNTKTTKAVHTDADGQFILNAPFDYTGPAKLVLLASDGSTRKFDITLDGKDHAYTLSIKTDIATGGVITFTPTGSVAKSVVIPPIFISDFQGVELIDNMLYLSVYSSGSVNLTIEDYSDSKSTYSNASIHFSSNDVNVTTDAGAVTISKNEFNNYTFKVSGQGSSYYWNGNQRIEESGTFSGEFSAPLLGKGKILKYVTKKEASFPSFTPWIDGKRATIGLQITESQAFGKGVLLWFYDKNLNYNDFKSFKTQAQAALGEPIADHDKEAAEGEYQDMCYSYFYKDNKFIMVSFCPWRDEEEENAAERGMGFECLRENHAARIQVHVLEGAIDLDKIMMEGHGIK